MSVDGIRPTQTKTSFYTKQELKNEAKSAAFSMAASAGLTLAVNRGQNPKGAAKVGLFAAGVSIIIGLIQKLVHNNSNKKAMAQENSNNEVIKHKLGYHQG